MAPRSLDLEPPGGRGRRRQVLTFTEAPKERMTTIESKQVKMARPAEEVYAFLQDMNNFQQLLPQDRISDWKADKDQCSFKVQGAATIGLKLDGGTPPSLVKMKATDRSPFPFTLDVHLTSENGHTSAKQVFNADLNPFIKVMVEKPLQNLFDHIADRLAEVNK
jgi:carbon monoxide dehydrogenase subunit G